MVSGASLAGKRGEGQGRRAAGSNSRRRSDERIDRHKDGSIKAGRYIINEVLTKYCEWFRKDGSNLHSGYFQNGEQVGEWTPYNGKGKIVKVTKMKYPL